MIHWHPSTPSIHFNPAVPHFIRSPLNRLTLWVLRIARAVAKMLNAAKATYMMVWLALRPRQKMMTTEQLYRVDRICHVSPWVTIPCVSQFHGSLIHRNWNSCRSPWVNDDVKSIKQVYCLGQLIYSLTNVIVMNHSSHSQQGCSSGATIHTVGHTLSDLVLQCDPAPPADPLSLTGLNWPENRKSRWVVAQPHLA